MTSSGLLKLMILAALLSLGACSSKPPAPVEERSGASGNYSLTRDGYYRVRRGDTLHAIAFNFSLDWRDIAAWNSIRSPYTIYPDQELRLSPPPGYASRTSSGSQSAGVVTRPASTPSASQTRSTTTTQDSPAKTSPAKTAASKPPPEQNTTTASAKPAQTQSAASQAPASSGSSGGKDPSSWTWPTSGNIVSSFRANDSARKGIDIGGKAGQDIRAAAAGEVVYSGSGMIGYGELIIVKHSDRMLSAYAHNSRRLVSEGQQVKRGEKIAEMGTNDRNQALLHFEIRANGIPQDPQKYLPKKR